MKITFEEIVENLAQVYDNMKSDGLDVGLVAHIGKVTKPIGDYFANEFGCELVYLPSLERVGRNGALTKKANKIYQHFPTGILNVFSKLHKRIHKSSKWVYPKNIPYDSLKGYEKELPILLVDDSVYTGATFERWKHKVEEVTEKQVLTFAITVTGSYKPNYYCLQGWHPFEWRPVGI